MLSATVSKVAKVRGILATQNFVSVVRGETTTLQVSVVDDLTSTPFDLTGYDVYFTVKKYIHEVEPLVQKVSSDPLQIAISNPRTGVVSVLLSASDTLLDIGEYVFDVWIQKDAERRSVLEPSVLEVVYSVTRFVR